MNDSGFSPRAARNAGRRIFVLPTLVATLALVLSTLVIVAAISLNAAYAATPGTASGDGSLVHVLGTLAGGLGGYAALRAISRD